MKFAKHIVDKNVFRKRHFEYALVLVVKYVFLLLFNNWLYGRCCKYIRKKIKHLPDYTFTELYSTVQSEKCIWGNYYYSMLGREYILHFIF